METKTIKGKAIRSPQGRAGEYARYACDFFCGCSCGCTYCFNKTGRFKDTLGGGKPTLKKYFRDEDHALEVFEKELKANLPELQKHGLFFCFLTDPMLPETKGLTELALGICRYRKTPAKILTKRADWVEEYLIDFHNFCLRAKTDEIKLFTDFVAFGLTLTGHDEIETGASTNAERIEAMQKLHEAGFKTWASIEPIISFPRSIEMVYETNLFCDLYKIGLERNKRYDKENLNRFINAVFD
ncbi:MAG: radical SAM protein, partial [Dysgonamonadaceae bacterium]|nr:radical SAM protein [Dysgonamonadaceae bacterium]